MDLRGLEAVIAVYEHGSFSSAAEKLFISQPALTRRVALLERELNARLFVRGPRGASLTDAGKALIEPARRALRATESIRWAIGQVHDGDRGSLSIVGTPNLTGGTLGSLLGEFHQRLPEIEIQVVSAETSAAATAMVEAGTHDLAIVDQPVTSPALSVTAVGQEEFLALMPAGSTGADQDTELRTVTQAMLLGLTMLHLPEARFPRQPGTQLFTMLAAEPSARIEVPDCGLMIQMTLSGRAVAVLPRTVAMAGRHESIDLALPPTPIHRSISIARHRGNRSAAARHFLELATARGELSA
ncbi:LysR family transcriptional regulator [Diaminobutyricibacter sp. McL0618]|uniref:LysR family transcriptional regulator n=1 Tax=Leifsonia sp. McL0618 TaxID=3415677 RepID=UPI003CF9CDF4